MRNIYEVLRHKETEIERLKKELQALRIVAPLLEDDLADVELQVAPQPARTYSSVQPRTIGVAADTKPVWP